jgi:hypothetical protein
VVQPYRLWTQARSWCNYELTVEKEFLPAIRSLFPPVWDSNSQNLSPDVDLVPEPDGPSTTAGMASSSGLG